MTIEQAIEQLERRRETLALNRQPTQAMLIEAVRITEKIDRLRLGRRTTDFRHGRTGYMNHGCRCQVCNDARMQYQREYRAKREAA